MGTYQSCTLCPRNCRVDRSRQKGVCQSSDRLMVSRAALHMWEEPCISAKEGSGAVFFAGCSLHCVFCQNFQISNGQMGQEITKEHLTELFYRLQEQGANNINLVTPDHYLPQIVWAVQKVKKDGFALPFIYNCSGYETLESLRKLEGLIDVYLPDFKYWNGETSARHCHAPNYPEVARAAIAEMVRQTGDIAFDQNGMLLRGVIVRHLLLPHGVSEAKHILRYLYETYKDRIYLSIMNQYTPPPELCDPVLGHCVSPSVYDALIDWAAALGITNAFIQEGGTVSESFIPKWELE